LLTTTETPALVADCPAAFVVTAESEWVPLVKLVVFRDRLKGAAVIAAPEFAPSTLNCTFFVLEETLVKMATVPEIVAPAVGEVMEIEGAEELLTVTFTAALVADWPAASLATAVKVWLPLERVAVFSARVNGAPVSAAPSSAPSTLNCTFVVFAETVVATATEPEIVAPAAGEAMEMVGAEVFFTVNATAALVPVWPAESEATAVMEWLPSCNLVVSSESSKGELFTDAPEFAPSTLNCTVTVPADTLVETSTVPDSVAPAAGDEMEMTGAAPGDCVPVFEPALVSPTQPAQ
jgi:hypothetical protein